MIYDYRLHVILKCKFYLMLKHYASRNGHADIFKLLIDKRASPNVQTKSGEVTPLHRAAYCGHKDIVKLLLQKGNEATICDEDGKLPLHKVYVLDILAVVIVLRY